MKLHTTIQESFNLLNLPDDWDGEGAQKVNEKAFNKAILFLVELMERVGDDIAHLHIDNMRDGKIGIEFLADRHDAFLLFSQFGVNAYLYIDGDREDGINSCNTDEIISWIEKYML